MKNKDLSIWKKFIYSFDNEKNGGFSGRKLSAFIAVSTAIYATYEFVDSTTVVSALMVWLTFALLCLGIVTAQQVLQFKNSEENKEINDNNNDDNTTEQL